MVVTDKDNYIVSSWSFGNLECAISQAVLTHEKNKEQKKKKKKEKDETWKVKTFPKNLMYPNWFGFGSASTNSKHMFRITKTKKKNKVINFPH